MSPALNEDGGLSARFLKRTTIIRRDMTPVKQPYPLLKCLFVLLKATKAFFYLCAHKRALVKLGRDNRGEGTLMQSTGLCLHVHVCACDRHTSCFKLVPGSLSG